MPGLEAHRVNVVPPGEISACDRCGARALGDQLQFVSFDTSADSEIIPADKLETMDRQAGRIVFQHRDAHGRGSVVSTLELPMMCSVCIAQAAGLIGFEDGTPLRAENDELRAELERTQAERDEAQRQRDEADETVRASATFERLLGAKPTKRTKAAA